MIPISPPGFNGKREFFAELLMIQAVTFCLIPETTFEFTFSPSQKGAGLPCGEDFFHLLPPYIPASSVRFVFFNGWCFAVPIFYPLWFRYHPYFGGWGKRQVFEKPNVCTKNPGLFFPSKRPDDANISNMFFESTCRNEPRRRKTETRIPDTHKDK